MNWFQHLATLAVRLGPWLSLVLIALAATFGFQMASNIVPGKAHLLSSVAWFCLFFGFAVFGFYLLRRRD